MSKKLSSLPRIFVSPEDINGNSIQIVDSHTIDKLRQVLRMHTGDEFRVFDGSGGEYLVEIVELRKDVIGCSIVQKIEQNATGSIKKPYLILAQALTRSSKLEEIVEKNTEIGVNEFVFFESDHSIVKCKDFHSKKFDRLNKIAIEATRQSEQSISPTINTDLIKYKEVAQIEADLKIFMYERSIDSIDNNLITLLENVNYNSKILVIVGPEGGFSQRELEFGLENFVPIHLTLPVLRTENAGMVLASHILLST